MADNPRDKAYQDKPFSPGSATDPRATPGAHGIPNPGAPNTNPPAREVFPGGAGSKEQREAALKTSPENAPAEPA